MLKQDLVSLLQADDLPAVAALAGRHKRVLSLLTGLTYHSDGRLVEAAIRAFGPAAQQVALSDGEYVRNHLRRLLWLVNDESGGIGWRAPELIAAVLAACPGQFDEFISPLVYLLDMEAEDAPRFWASLLAAIAHLAAQRPQAVRLAAPLLRASLPHLPPLERSQALELIQRLAEPL